MNTCESCDCLKKYEEGYWCSHPGCPVQWIKHSNTFGCTLWEAVSKPIELEGEIEPHNIQFLPTRKYTLYTKYEIKKPGKVKVTLEYL